MIAYSTEELRVLDLVAGIMDNFPSIMIVINEDEDVVFCNLRAKTVINANIGDSYKDFIRNKELKKDKRVGASKDDIFYNGRWYKVFHVSIVWIGDMPGSLVVWSDITEIKNSETHFRKIATIDAMTSIYNRQTGIDFLETYLDILRNGGNTFTVCFVDLNELKFVNDNFGHLQGDVFIQTVVSAIKSSIRQTDIFARMGGDEFIIIFPKCYSQVVEDIMVTVVKKLQDSSASNRVNAAYSVSYGIMEICPDSILSSEHILNSVDAKMYTMKENYRKNKKK